MEGAASMEIRGPVELPARREDIELQTLDGLTLVGELALPQDREPVATLVTLHPLPTAGGFMDSHILRKAAARLPALADLGVLRFNVSPVLNEAMVTPGAPASRSARGSAWRSFRRNALALATAWASPDEVLAAWS